MARYRILGIDSHESLLDEAISMLDDLHGGYDWRDLHETLEGLKNRREALRQSVQAPASDSLHQEL